LAYFASVLAAWKNLEKAIEALLGVEGKQGSIPTLKKLQRSIRRVEAARAELGTRGGYGARPHWASAEVN
jgi:hypothetical protein